MPTNSSDAATKPALDIWDVVTRVHRKHQNEVAEDRQGSPEEARERIGRWLAGVSYDEWFALVRTAENYAVELARAAMLAEHLHAMIDKETWRATGGDDSQGHYEGDVHAENVLRQIESWKELADVVLV